LGDPKHDHDDDDDDDYGILCTSLVLFIKYLDIVYKQAARAEAVT
jgi:hypothetical protein